LIISKARAHKIAKPGEPIAQQAVVEAILDKHDAATNSRRFNALLATASINNAIEYYQLFKEIQKRSKQKILIIYPLILLVYSLRLLNYWLKKVTYKVKKMQPISNNYKRIWSQEKEDNKQNPEEKKKALKNYCRLQFTIRHQPQHLRVRFVLSGYTTAYQRPEIQQQRLSAQKQD
jgi:type I restriction enzyme, R subunit